MFVTNRYKENPFSFRNKFTLKWHINRTAINIDQRTIFVSDAASVWTNMFWRSFGEFQWRHLIKIWCILHSCRSWYDIPAILNVDRFELTTCYWWATFTEPTTIDHKAIICFDVGCLESNVVHQDIRICWKKEDLFSWSCYYVVKFSMLTSFFQIWLVWCFLDTSISELSLAYLESKSILKKLLMSNGLYCKSEFVSVCSSDIKTKTCSSISWWIWNDLGHVFQLKGGLD